MPGVIVTLKNEKTGELQTWSSKGGLRDYLKQTLATDPLIQGAALRPGVHLDLVGAYRPDMREADALALKRALLVVDTRAGGLAEAGDVVQAIAEGAFTGDHVVADLAELCRGTHPGRQSVDQITAFKSVGWAGEDLAAAVLAYGG